MCGIGSRKLSADIIVALVGDMNVTGSSEKDPVIRGCVGSWPGSGPRQKRELGNTERAIKSRSPPK